MNTMDTVRAALLAWPQCRLDGGTVVVPTQCLYPSNGVVNVYVDGRESEFVVHDNGEAFDQLHAVGGYEAAPYPLIAGIVRRRGLSVSDAKSIFVKDIKPDALAAAIALVANASKEAAEHLIARMRPGARRPLTDEVEAILNLRFPARWRREELYLGASTKPHRFDYVINLDDHRKILMDIVKPEASSINATVVAHLDVANAHPKGLLHRAVFDDQDKWSAENLSLLRVATTPVPLSAANDALMRLAA